MPLTVSREPGTSDERSPWWTVAIMVALLVVTGAVVVAATTRHHPTEAQETAPPLTVSPIQGPVRRPAVIRDGAGRQHTCPSGAVPSAVLEGLDMRPRPAGGVWALPGHYRVTVRGRLVNETNAAIRVSAIHLAFGHTDWPVPTRFHRVIQPYSSTPLRVQGGLRNPHRERLSLTARLAWDWRDPELRPCRSRRLVEDD